MLHGAVLRPPAPAAVLRTVDGGPAEAMPGVTVVRDGDFVGVAAGDPLTARRAVAAIKADWDVPAPGPADLAGYLRSHPVDGRGLAASRLLGNRGHRGGAGRGRDRR